VRVRVLVSAKDGPTLFDLRCQVREGLVVYLQREHAHALPRVRTEGVAGGPASSSPAPTSAEGLFTGSSEGRERSKAFAPVG
jgi:hypothetical protein